MHNVMSLCLLVSLLPHLSPSLRPMGLILLMGRYRARVCYGDDVGLRGLHFTDVPDDDGLEYITSVSATDFRSEDFQLWIWDAPDIGQGFITRENQVLSRYMAYLGYLGNSVQVQAHALRQAIKLSMPFVSGKTAPSLPLLKVSNCCDCCDCCYGLTGNCSIRGS